MKRILLQALIGVKESIPKLRSSKTVFGNVFNTFFPDILHIHTQETKESDCFDESSH